MGPAYGTPAPKRASRVRPAVQIVERVERLWEPDKQRAGDRAMLIVQRLIETGHLTGTMQICTPIAPQAD